MSTLEQYQSSVAEKTKALKEVKDYISALQGLGDMNKLNGILNDPRVIAHKNGWIDNAGTYWTGADAQAQHATAFDQVNNWKNNITVAQQKANDLQISLNNAKADLENYEKSSPVVKAKVAGDAILSTIAASQKTKIILIVGAILIGITFIFGVVIYFKDRKKYALQTQTT